MATSERKKRFSEANKSGLAVVGIANRRHAPLSFVPFDSCAAASAPSIFSSLPHFIAIISRRKLSREITRNCRSPRLKPIPSLRMSSVIGAAQHFLCENSLPNSLSVFQTQTKQSPKTE
ncbi:hypothetical protein Syun_016477 [Stephania yunnanensis]|uniref:Uncharacterized protein n=1 Tax=Stephania yunnanensis TaxID=152371 RepID=A0AAP0J6R1_9MAGN